MSAKVEIRKAIREVTMFGPETELADKLEIAAHLFVEHAIDSMDQMSGKDSMIAAGISIEKMQLLRGLPTEIAGSVGILIKIGERAAAENLSLSALLTALLESMK